MLKQKEFLILLTITLIGCNSGGVEKGYVSQQTKGLNIQNGIPVDDPEINGMVPLILIGNSSLCTGTVISPNTILTAAHCVLNLQKKPSGSRYSSENITPAKNITVIFSKDLSEPVNINDKDQELEFYSVKDVHVHEDAFLGATVLKDGSFKIFNLSEINDLAILKLKTSLSTKRHPAARLATTTPKKGSKILIAGYGVDNGSEVEVDDPYNGEAGVLRFAAAKIAMYDSKFLFVGGVLDPVLGYTRICSGDSGGPDLIHNPEGGYQIIGVHSFGNGEACGTSRSTGASINVADYLDWVDSF